MACRGVYFALTEEDVRKLLSADDDVAVMAIIQEDIEQRWDEEWLCETDKAWDAMHRCLSDGSLKCRGKDVLEKCVLGGRQLHQGNEYIVSFLPAEDVAAVALAVGNVNREWLKQRYFGLRRKFLWFDVSDYSPIDDEDFEYTWEFFEATRAFFQKAAAAQRAVVFTVDQ